MRLRKIVSKLFKDKDYPSMIASLSEVADRVFTLAPADTPRALDPQFYAAEFEKLGIPAEWSATVFEAAEKALASSRDCGLPIVCLGSLSIYREIREAFSKLLPR